MSTPPFHPEWLITFWLTTPGIRSLDPHVTTVIILAIIILVGIYYLRKNKAPKQDEQEVYFQHLLQKKHVIDNQIKELKTQLDDGEISQEDYDKKLVDYETYLKKVKQDLLEFT